MDLERISLEIFEDMLVRNQGYCLRTDPGFNHAYLEGNFYAFFRDSNVPLEAIKAKLLRKYAGTIRTSADGNRYYDEEPIERWSDEDEEKLVSLMKGY